jgi:outer membrane protein assembly factor BamB
MVLVQRLTVMATVLAFSMSPVLAEGWSRFRGPNGSGVAESSNMPVEFSPQENLEWVTEVPFARSSPVLTGDRIFLTAVDDGVFTTLGFDRATGQELWRRHVERARQTEMHQDTDSATPSPVTDGERVYAFFQETGLVAYTAEGEEIWHQPLGPFRNFYGMTASPILAGDALILVCDQNTGSFLLALEKKTGQEIWRQERPARGLSYTTPILFPDEKQPRAIIVLGDQWIDAHDLASGETLWTLGGLGSGPVSSPVLAGNRLFVNAPDQAPEPPPPFSQLAAEHDSNGDGVLTRPEVEGSWMTRHFGFVDWDGNGEISKQDWSDLHDMMTTDGWGIYALRIPAPGSEPVTLWRSQQSVPYIPTGIVYDGVLYMVKDGIVSSFDPRSGELLERGRLTKGSPKTYASPVAADGKIYIGTLEGQMAVLQAGGDWEVLALNELGDEIWATPAIGDEHLYVRTRGKLFSFAVQAPERAATSP